MPVREFKADLHIHSCLSPCADMTMRPTAIIEQVVARKLDLIGICDHNCAENATAVKKAGIRAGVQVLGGLEITTREEVHILGLFENEAELCQMQRKIYANLPGVNDEKTFGQQLVVDDHDEPVGKNNRLLIGATNLTVEDVVKLIHDLEGLAIASHIDRQSFSLISQLGIIPADLELDALEISANVEATDRLKYKKYDLPLVTFSDAHFLTDIGRTYTVFRLKEPTLKEIKKALQDTDGRSILTHT